MIEIKKLSITKRVKDYCIEYTSCIYKSDKKIERSGVNDKKLITNLARARREIIDLIRLNLNVGSCLLTLTYRDNVQDYNKAYRDFYKFVMRVKYSYSISLRYIRVIELQQRGAIHFHVVIFNPEFVNIPYNDVFDTWGHGAIHIRPIENINDVTADKVGNYLGKYLTKSKDIACNKKIYTTSRNIKRIHKERFVIDNESLFNLYDEYFEKFADIVIDDGSIYKKYIKSL